MEKIEAAQPGKESKPELCPQNAAMFVRMDLLNIQYMCAYAFCAFTIKCRESKKIS
jgi:hypothetical protein